jgi:hypothetical protein
MFYAHVYAYTNYLINTHYKSHGYSREATAGIAMWVRYHGLPIAGTAELHVSAYLGSM